MLVPVSRGDVVVYEYLSEVDTGAEGRFSPVWRWAVGRATQLSSATRSILLHPFQRKSVDGNRDDETTASNRSLVSMQKKKTQDLHSLREENLQLALEMQKRVSDVEQQKAAVQRELDVVLPALQSARQAVLTISTEALRELRSYVTPPATVKRVLEMVISVLDSPPGSDWDVIKAFVKRDTFIALVRDFPEGTVKPDIVQHIRRNHLDDPDFSLASARRASKAAGPLYEWVVAQLNCSDVMIRLQPLHAKQAELQASLLPLQAKIVRNVSLDAKLQSELQSLQVSIVKPSSRVDDEELLGHTTGCPNVTEWEEHDDGISIVILHASVLRVMPAGLDATYVSVAPWAMETVSTAPACDDLDIIDGNGVLSEPETSTTLRGDQQEFLDLKAEVDRLRGELTDARHSKAVSLREPPAERTANRGRTQSSETQTDFTDQRPLPASDQAAMSTSCVVPSPMTLTTACGGVPKESTDEWQLLVVNVPRHTYLIASFRVVKVVPGIVLSAANGRKLKRVWRVHVLDGMFHNIDGKSITQSFAAADLILVEKDNQSSIRLRLKFLNTEKSHELLFESAHLRQRFVELCNMMRPGIASCSNTLGSTANVRWSDFHAYLHCSVTSIDATGPHAVQVEYVDEDGRDAFKKLTGRAQSRVSRMPSQPLTIWCGVHHLGDHQPIPSVADMRKWLPKGNHCDVIVVGVQRARGQRYPDEWNELMTRALNENVSAQPGPTTPTADPPSSSNRQRVRAFSTVMGAMSLVASTSIGEATIVTVWCRKILLPIISNVEGSQVRITSDGHGAAAVSVHILDTSFAFVNVSLPEWAEFSAGTQSDSDENRPDDSIEVDEMGTTLAASNGAIPIDAASGNEMREKDDQLQYILREIYVGATCGVDSPPLPPEVQVTGSSAMDGQSTIENGAFLAPDFVSRFDHVFVFGTLGSPLLGATTDVNVMDALGSHNYTEAVERFDPLTRVMSQEGLCGLFDEPPITFGPTGFGQRGPGYFSRILTRSNVQGSVLKGVSNVEEAEEEADGYITPFESAGLTNASYQCDEACAASVFLPVSGVFRAQCARPPLSIFEAQLEPLPLLRIETIRLEILCNRLLLSHGHMRASLQKIFSDPSGKDADYHSDGTARICSQPLLLATCPITKAGAVYDPLGALTISKRGGGTAAPTVTFLGAGEQRRCIIEFVANSSGMPLMQLCSLTQQTAVLENSRVTVSLFNARPANASSSSATTSQYPPAVVLTDPHRLVCVATLPLAGVVTRSREGEVSTHMAALQRAGRTVGRCVIGTSWVPNRDSDEMVRGMW